MSTTEFLKWVRLLIGSGSLLIPVNKHQFDVCTHCYYCITTILPEM